MLMQSLKQTQALISTYAADVSGVCSALYELGGMSVMHDASGCNSTYNTHDEPRWYSMDSLVFISAISEMEAVMGDDEKLISDICTAAEKFNPRFVAVAGTPIPMMTGCDLPAIARAVEYRTGIPAFGFNTNGMRSYVSGAGAALAVYAERFVKKPTAHASRSLNILGVTPLDFSVNGTDRAIAEKLENAGFSVISSFAMGSTPEQLEKAAEASVNLVISAAGIKTAEYFYSEFGTPYVVGIPYDGFENEVFFAIRTAEKTGVPVTAFGDFVPQGDLKVVIIGEGVASRSLAAAIFNKYGISASVICPLEAFAGVLSRADRYLSAECDIAEALKTAEIVIADPLYKPILKTDCRFYPLAHEAFSGRIFRKDIPNLVNKI